MEKRGMCIWIVAVLLLLGIFPAVVADTDLGDPCTSEEDCSIYAELGYDFAVYCHPQAGTCYAVDGNEPEPTSTAPGSSGTPGGASSASISSASAAEIRQLQTSMQTISSGLAVTQGRVAAVEQSVGSVQTSLQDLNNKLNQLSTGFREFQSQQQASQETVESDLEAVATGLAGLQDNVAETQENVALLGEKVEESASTTGLLVTILAIAAILMGIVGSAYWWYRRSAGGQRDLHPTILQFITDHVRAGKKFHHIKEGLAQAGWSQDDAAWAYKETLKKNYQQYRASQSSGNDTSAKAATTKPTVQKKSNEKNKMLIVTVVSLLLVVGIFFAIKGATGQAIHFTAEIELETFVQDLLERLADENDFFLLIPAANLCVEVFDQDLFVAHQIQVANGVHHVLKIERCSGSAQYDAAVRFTDWQTFSTVMRKMSCDVVANQHGKGFWVLPSKYILPGFKKNPFADYTPFCPVLQKCVDQQTLQELKIVC